MLAAKTRNVRVYAFEPEAENFALLNRNVRINNLAEAVTTWPVALSDELGVGILYLSDGILG